MPVHRASSAIIKCLVLSSLRFAVRLTYMFYLSPSYLQPRIHWSRARAFVCIARMGYRIAFTFDERCRPETMNVIRN